MQTVLVTGGSGFLGGWCAVELLRRGYAVRTTVRDRSRETDVRAGVATQVDAGERLEVVEADLTADAGWPEAVAGCDYVLHVASPFPPKQPKNPDELIVPAREGTRRVLRAAFDAGVERVVVTSSVAAISGSGKAPGAVLTEEDWSDPDSTKLTPYARSKTAAELAAWELARERGATERLTTVNPGAIVGPVLHDDHSYSLDAVKRLLEGTPGIPRIGFSFVDVRDVAALEVEAMTAPGAAGKRLIATASFLWLGDVAAILRESLGEAASKVPKRKVPNFVVRAMGVFDPSVRSVAGQLGKRVEYSNERARGLGWSPRPVEDTVLDCARSLTA